LKHYETPIPKLKKPRVILAPQWVKDIQYVEHIHDELGFDGCLGFG
jgi:hypothetical protein